MLDLLYFVLFLVLAYAYAYFRLRARKALLGDDNHTDSERN